MRRVPSINEGVVVRQIGTPLTHARFLRRHRGNYGLALAAGGCAARPSPSPPPFLALRCCLPLPRPPTPHPVSRRCEQRVQVPRGDHAAARPLPLRRLDHRGHRGACGGDQRRTVRQAKPTLALPCYTPLAHTLSTHPHTHPCPPKVCQRAAQHLRAAQAQQQDQDASTEGMIYRVRATSLTHLAL